MKKSDWALLMLVAGGSVLVAFLVSNSIFGKVEDRTQTVPTFEPSISAEIAQPRTDIFNEDAINPTVEIEVGRREARDAE